MKRMLMIAGLSALVPAALAQSAGDPQVRTIKYCGDTYTIDTADGKTEKIWEFNLRFKSDSSKLG